MKTKAAVIIQTAFRVFQCDTSDKLTKAVFEPKMGFFCMPKAHGKLKLFGSTHLSEVSRKCTLTGLSHRQDYWGSRKIVPDFA